MLGGTLATVVVATATLVIAAKPAQPARPVNVVVTNPDGQRETLTGGFTFKLFSLPGQIIPPKPALPASVSVCPRNSCAMPDTTGYITKTVCASGCDYTSIQRAFNAEACGAGKIIEIIAGQTFTGSVSLLAKSCKAGKWFIVRSSAHASLPAPGTRVGPGDLSKMPTLVCSVIGAACFRVANSNHRIRLTGLHIRVPTSGSFDNTDAILNIGDAGDWGQNTDGKIPQEIIVDRVVLDGGSDSDPTKQVRAGITMNCNHCAVVDSYIDDVHSTSSQSSGIRGWNANGPWLIQNNYIEASGIGFGTGGSGPAIPGKTWPKDITFRRNYVFKPHAWEVGDPSYAGVRWVVVNMLELKAASRVLIEGNVFENNWSHAQTGTGILFNDCPSGTSIGITVDNITFRFNKVIGAEGGAMSLAGQNACQGSGSSSGTFFLHIHDNLFDQVGGHSGRYVLLSTTKSTSGGLEGTLFRHNTMIMTDRTSSVFAFAWFASGTPFTQLGVHDNIFGTGSSTSNQKTNIIDRSCGSSSYTANSWFKNLVYRAKPTSTYCPSTFDQTAPWGTNKAACVADIDDVGFVDLARGNFRLGPGSPGKNAATDGKDVGADIDALEAATAGVKP